jgi:hypothetical protein
MFALLDLVPLLYHQQQQQQQQLAYSFLQAVDKP